MKKDKKQERIETVPQGSYEAGPVHCEGKKKEKRDPNEITTDLQGNGYPAGRNREEQH